MILGPPIVPAGSQDTSQEAARSVRGHAATDEVRVLLALHEQADTDDGIEVRLGMKHQTASARRRGLAIKQYVEKSGHRAVTRSGRSAHVWVVTEKGRKVCDRYLEMKRSQT